MQHLDSVGNKLKREEEVQVDLMAAERTVASVLMPFGSHQKRMVVELRHL